jgi:low affinity Fe/Cu permease
MALLCSWVMIRDAIRKPRADKVVWGIAFALFAIAAGADAIGRGVEWIPWLAKTYYASGVALVVTFLAIGQLYLLFPQAMKRFGVGGTVLFTALWVSLVINAPIDESRLAEDGWEAIERGPEMVAVSIIINTIGTLIIVAGTAVSVWRFRRSGANRNRMWGCALILVGTLVVAAGGSLTRFGHYEYLYIAMSIGIALIFGGVLLSRRPDQAQAAIEPVGNAAVRDEQAGKKLELAETPAVAIDGLAFVERMLQRSADEIDVLCTEWSVPRDPADAMSRSDARRAWRLRSKLSPEAVALFDGQPVGARRQVTTLYHDVLAWERGGREEIAEFVPNSEGVGLVRKSE